MTVPDVMFIWACGRANKMLGDEFRPAVWGLILAGEQGRETKRECSGISTGVLVSISCWARLEPGSNLWFRHCCARLGSAWKTSSMDRRPDSRWDVSSPSFALSNSLPELSLSPIVLAHVSASRAAARRTLSAAIWATNCASMYSVASSCSHTSSSTCFPQAISCFCRFHSSLIQRMN